LELTIEPEKEITTQINKETEKGIFCVEEIRIEELAIDGICGVY
jgi:mycofactocin precursor